MKETGIIRKVDELGRIVLPKEIRKTLGIKDGEDLEIYVKDKTIYLQKYSHLWGLKDIASYLVDNAKEQMNLDMAISDKEEIIASSDFLQQGSKLPSSFSKLLESFEEYESISEETNFDKKGWWYIKPINIHGDMTGFIILYNKEKILPFMKSFLSFLEKIIVNKIDIM